MTPETPTAEVPRRVARTVQGEPATSPPAVAGGTTPPPAAPAPGGKAGTPSSSLLKSEAPQAAARTKKSARGAGASPTSLADLHAAAMSEAELEEQVRDACEKLGVIRIHIYHARGTTAGVPDDILIGPRGVLWRELKTMTGQVSPAQRAMGEALLAAGQDWALWRPVDWFSDRIRLELMAVAGLTAGAA